MIERDILLEQRRDAAIRLARELLPCVVIMYRRVYGTPGLYDPANRMLCAAGELHEALCALDAAERGSCACATDLMPSVSEWADAQRRAREEIEKRVSDFQRGQA